MMSLIRRIVLCLFLLELFLVCTSTAQATTEVTSQCSTGLPALDSLQPSEDLSEIAPLRSDDGAIQVIAPEIKFNCYGVITEWTALVTLNDVGIDFFGHQLYLQVWRPNSEIDGKFELIGSNYFADVRVGASDVNQDFNLTFHHFTREISKENQIRFQPNDILGWYSPPREGLRPGFGVAAYSNASSPQLLSATNSSSISCELYRCDEEVQPVNFLPLISVQYETIAPGSVDTPNVTCTSQDLPQSCVVPTTTTVTNTSPPTPPLPTTEASIVPMYLYIIAGVVPSTVIIVVILCALLMCLVCRRNGGCYNHMIKTENTNPTYSDPEDFIRLNQPPFKPQHQASGFFSNTGDSPIPHTPVGFVEEDRFDGCNYASTYQANGENHIYHELVKTPEPPPLPDRSSFGGSFKKGSSIRFSVQSISQFPYTLPNTPAPAVSCPYIDAVPSLQTLPRALPRTPQDSPPSSASEVSPRSITMRKLFHALDDEGFRVPTAEERELYDDTRVEDIYSKLQRPFSGNKTRDSRDDTFFQQSDIYWEPSHSSNELFNQLAQRKYREIKRSQIRTLEKLGGGHFSSVHKGVWDVPGGCVEVAVKTLKPNASEKDKVKFLQEAAIMGQFLHPNVIKLQGVVTIGEPVMIVLEVMPKGDLKNFVRSLRSKPKPNDLPNMFLRFCREVAFGMNYLSNKGYIHRDLAARNILLTEDLTCKIADFGMARDVDVDHIYQSAGGKIPIKWTAPEGLKHRQYSTASDVWSYGMLLFEIWTLGRNPYEGTSTDELMNFMESFHCQAPPPGTPRELYRLIVQCWHPVPTERPSFSEVSTFLNSTDEVLLNWSNADKSTGPRVMEIGAPLSEGVNLYLDLQHIHTVPQDLQGSTGSITAV